MTANNEIEEIQLTATPVDDEAFGQRDRPVRFRFQIQQNNPSRGIEKQIAVGDDARIYVKDRAVRHNHAFELSLASLDPEPRKQLQIAAIWGYLALAALVIGLLHYLVSLTSLGGRLPYSLLPVYILSGAFGLFFLIGLFYKSRYQYGYRTRHGKVDLITLLYGRPSRDKFRDFLARLTGSIREAQRSDLYDPNQLLANELREHRQLMEAGILSSEIYEMAKSRILASHGK